MSAGHVLPVRVYLSVFGALITLTALTTWIAYLDLGPLNTVIALTIAVTKSLLVVLYFMHVRYSSRLVMVFSIAGFYWLILLLGFVMSDYLTRTSVSGWDR